MEIKNLPKKYKKIWDLSLPYLKKGRKGDDLHAMEVVEFILEYNKKESLDLDVLIPLAIMHDIGHCAILPEHFKFITGSHKIINGKIVHMLAGAKIAKDILDEVGYPKEKIEEIADIISVHDGDQIKDWNPEEIYNTKTKKIFHDIDCLDRYNSERIEKIKEHFDGDKNKVLEVLRDALKVFILPEFKKIAEEKMNKLENE